MLGTMHGEDEMTDQEILEKMKDKKLFKKATNEIGLLFFFFSNYKSYME